MSDNPLTAVQYGLGPIGSRIASAAHRAGYEFVGAVDIDPEKTGRDIGAVAGFERVDVDVTDDADEALSANPDVVFHSTVSSLEAAAPQLKTIAAAGANVVSTTEELAYPWWNHSDIAEDIDETAKKHGVTSLGTGINPGFVMDTMPAMLSTPMAEVNSATVNRVQDAGQRRKPLQEKVGAGVSVETFNSEIATKAGHVGSTESVAMLADALGFDLDEIDESIEPVIADAEVESEHKHVESGEVAGLRQTARGYADGEPVIVLILEMYVGAEESRDRVDFEGSPEVSITIDGGFHGDIATSAVVTNVAPTVVSAPAGVTTMTEIPVPSFTRNV